MLAPSGVLGAWSLPAADRCRSRGAGPRRGSVPGTLRGETCMEHVKGYTRDTKRAADHRLGSDPSTAVY